MTCICAQKLSDLLAALASLQPPAVELPLPLQQLSTMQLGGAASASAQASLSAAASMNLPPLALSAATMAQLSAVAQATASVEAGLGIDLTAPDAAMQLDASIGAANANLTSFAPLAALDPGPWMSLSTLASLALNCKLAFGVNLLAAGGSAALSAALSASASASASMPSAGVSASLQSYASLASVASSLGVDLSQPGAVGALSAQANAVADLSIPALAIPAGGLLSPLALLTAIANIIAGLGLMPTSPGFADMALELTAGLPAFESLEIPLSLAANAGTPSGAALDAMAGLDFQALAGLDVSALAGFQAPNLGPLTALSSFSASCAAAGFPVASSSACGASCPMSLAVV